MRNQLLVNLAERMIKNGQTEGLQEKLDVFLLVGSIDINDYMTLMEMMSPELIEEESQVEETEDHEDNDNNTNLLPTIKEEEK